MKGFWGVFLFILLFVVQIEYARAGDSSETFKDAMLGVHNKERSLIGISPVSWNQELVEEAQQWANYLSKANKFEHASNSNGHGENLWMGSVGAFSYASMAQSWADEKKYFQYGVFPKVSTTGNWYVVGHYTQMIWKDTTQIGCAYASNSTNTITVCRYNPSGNYFGQKPY